MMGFFWFCKVTPRTLAGWRSSLQDSFCFFFSAKSDAFYRKHKNDRHNGAIYLNSTKGVKYITKNDTYIMEPASVHWRYTELSCTIRGCCVKRRRGLSKSFQGLVNLLPASLDKNQPSQCTDIRSIKTSLTDLIYEPLKFMLACHQ